MALARGPSTGGPRSVSVGQRHVAWVSGPWPVSAARGLCQRPVAPV